MTSFTDLTIISGGQTGADRGALVGARKVGLRTGGYAPKGFRTEAGNDLTLRTEFNLIAHERNSHAARDKANADIAHGMVAFRFNIPRTGRGTERTIQYIRGGKYEHVIVERQAEMMELSPLVSDSGKPVLVLWDVDEHKIQRFAARLRQFVEERGIRVLLVGGPCASTISHAQDTVAAVIERAFS